MNRREFLRCAGAMGTAAILSQLRGNSQAFAGSRPNILFFFVDDMGSQDTSEPFYKEVTDLNRRYRTPNMERLADEGMKFTQAYAYAVCSPSRVSLMTGMNAARHKVTNWTLRKNKSPDPEDPGLEMPDWNMNGISPMPGVERTVYAKTLPMYLREAGYRTIHVGKAHWGSEGMPGENPLNLGFDVNIGGHAAGGPGSYLGEHNYSALWRTNDPIWDVPGLDTYHGTDVNLTEALTREATKAVKQAVAEDKPFYLYMSHYAVHAPLEKDARFYEKYAEAGLPEPEAVYASMIESMDKSLGDLMGLLSELGIADNTIILFMSDNGAAKHSPQNKPLRGHKLLPYEGGIRVPMIAKWPGVTPAGSECGEYVMVDDIFPSILELAGIRSYEQPGGKVDGCSFVPLLKQATGYPKDRALVWHYPHSYDQLPYSVIRKGDWKLIYFHRDQHYELYNIARDIGEEKDLYMEEHKIANQLADELGKYLRETKAQMPVVKKTGKPVPLPGLYMRQQISL